jgi:vacuolar-type H+-ATPase subunit I/STV1
VASTIQEKKRYVREYVQSLKAIEDAIEPFKEQKRELRAEFRDRGWLNTDEIRAAVKAYRLYKGKMNIDEIYENFHTITGVGEEQ